MTARVDGQQSTVREPEVMFGSLGRRIVEFNDRMEKDGGLAKTVAARSVEHRRQRAEIKRATPSYKPKKKAGPGWQALRDRTIEDLRKPVNASTLQEVYRPRAARAHSETDDEVWYGDDYDRKCGKCRSYTGSRRVWAYVGDIIITLGVVLCLFVIWAVFWTDVQSGRKQDEAQRVMEQQWSQVQQAPTAGSSTQADRLQGAPSAYTVVEGQGFAKIHAPSMGDEFTRTVVGGTSQSSLATGPGYYFGSAAPGQKGNFAIAGHRDGQGAPFHDIDKFHACDAIVIETATQWMTYRVLPVDVYGGYQDYANQALECMPAQVVNSLSASEYAGLKGRVITQPTDVDVVAPVPGHPEVSPDDARLSLLTLTTCHPLWSNQQRLIVHAALTDVTDKSAHPQGWTPKMLEG